MMIEPSSRNKKLLLIIFLLGLLVGIIVFIQKESLKNLHKNDGKNVLCTQDARLCPDGSYVGRTGPDCEFSPCPEESTPFSSDFINEEMKKEITLALLSNESLSWQTTPGGRRFCIVQNLEPSKDLFPFYVWARCGEFTFLKDSLQERSGVSVPTMIDYPNELSYRDPARFTIRIPRDGAAYSEDIKNIFPENLHRKIYSYNNDSISKKLRDEALAYFLSVQTAESHPAWQAIKEAIENCEVEQVFQAHSLAVSAKLKDGRTLEATEPRIDDIITLALSAQSGCGEILMATE